MVKAKAMVKVVVPPTLTEMQVFFIEENTGKMEVTDLVRITGADEGLVTNLVNEVLAERKSKTKFAVYAGTVSMTEAQSMADDESPKESQEEFLKRNAAHIHKIEPKRKR